MPGSVFDLYCPGCRTIHEVHTGGSYCWNHAGQVWMYEQYQCPNCQLIRPRHLFHGKSTVCDDCR